MCLNARQASGLSSSFSQRHSTHSPTFSGSRGLQRQWSLTITRAESQSSSDSKDDGKDTPLSFSSKEHEYRSYAPGICTVLDYCKDALEANQAWCSDLRVVLAFHVSPFITFVLDRSQPLISNVVDLFSCWSGAVQCGSCVRLSSIFAAACLKVGSLLFHTSCPCPTRAH